MHVIDCPQCRRKLHLPDSCIGQTVQCPQCRHVFVATRPDELPAATPLPTPEPSPGWPEQPAQEPDISRTVRRRPLDYEDGWDDEREPVRRPRLGPRRLPHRSSTIHSLAIVSIFLCGPVLAPLAWIMGNQDLQAMDEGRMDDSGRAETLTGRNIAIVSTVIHATLFLIGLLMLASAGMWRW